MDSAEAVRTSGLTVGCSDCGRSVELFAHEDHPRLLVELRGFLSEHERCSYSISVEVPVQPKHVPVRG